MKFVEMSTHLPNFGRGYMINLRAMVGKLDVPRKTSNIVGNKLINNQQCAKFDGCVKQIDDRNQSGNRLMKR